MKTVVLKKLAAFIPALIGLFFSFASNAQEATVDPTEQEDHFFLEASVSVAPNPFTDYTVIQFSFRQDTKASMAILDETGRMITNLAADYFPAGEYRLVWEGLTDSGEKVGTGIYLLWIDAYNVQTGEYLNLVEKIIVER